MKKIVLTFIIFSITMFQTYLRAENTIVSTVKLKDAMPLVDRGVAAAIVVDAADYEVVKVAANDLRNDIQTVTGVAPKLVNKVVSTSQIIIGTLGHSQLIDDFVKRSMIDISKLQNQWEKFLIQTVPGTKTLLIIGSDRRGTAYGVYELSKQIGVSPWYWWADVPVKKSKSLFVKQGSFFFGPPSVKYRGIFINDEEQGLLPWARNVYDPETKQLGPKTYAKVYELMLRLKANLLWPGMKKAKSFYNVTGNKEMADKYAIIVGTSHHEPLSVNSSLEWNEKKDGPWQYDKNADALKRVMEKRVQEIAPYENIYTIGLRGHADKGMEAEGGIDGRINLMQTIFADQRTILQKHINRPLDSIPQAFTAYKEVLELLNYGLKVPDDAILVWPDDNYGYIRQLNSDIQKRRSGGAGVYYHLNYVGRPYYINWLSAPSPELIRKELNKAYGNGATKLWMFNVGDIKPYEYLTSYCLDMAWNFSYNDTSLTRKHMDNWVENVFGKKLSAEIIPLLREYYQTSFERKPEFMGWARCEPNTPIVDSEYSLTNYNELQRRLSTLNALSNKTKELFNRIPEQLQSSYFQLLYYPVLCADLTNKKMLYAQINHAYAAENRISANRYADLSRIANDSIILLTKQFGETNNGKWKEMMKAQTSIPKFQNVSPAKEVRMDIDFSGNNPVKGAAESYGLPYFNRYFSETYEVQIFNQGLESFKWKATPTSPWIQLSNKTGICKEEERITVTIDWNQVPDAEYNYGDIVIEGAGIKKHVGVTAFKPAIPADSLKNLFVEQNGAISIYAANFSRKNDKDAYQWTTLNDVGLTGKLVAITNDTLPQIGFEWDFAKNAPSLEYDFYTCNSGWMDIQSFTLPTQAISLQRGCMYGISIDNQPPKIIDFSTRNRNEEWQLNVMRNAAIKESRHFIERPGKHTLKLWLIDTDVCFDKFIINTGGLKKSYVGPTETKL